MPDSKLLIETFHIVRHNRYLWFFGIFAGTGSANFPYFNAGSGDSSDSSASTGSSIDPGVIVAIVAVALVLFLVFFALSVIAQGALSDGVAAAHRGEERRFGTAWRAGRATFWRILGLFLLVGLIALGLVLLIVVPLGVLVFGVFSASDDTAVRIVVGIVAGLSALTMLVVVFIPYSVIVQWAIRGVTLGGTPIRESLRAGWLLFRHNLGASLLVFGIQYGVTIVASIAITIVGAVVAIPVVILVVATDAAAVAVVAVVLAALLLLPLLLAATGALGAYTHGLWTLSYLRLTGTSAVPT